jgi:Fe-S-cluster-containing dehydrogenase component
VDIHPRALEYPESSLDRMIPDESELTAGVRIEPGKSYGFFTDTTLCIGCKACEVACKEWNNLPADELHLTGHSYDNTGRLSADTWRHVNFIERSVRADDQHPFQSGWLMMSDVCKHCHNAPCLEACPTGALFRTEFDTVVVQQDICNGCGYCQPACPFGVIDISVQDGKAGWNRPAPRPAPPTRSSSASCRNCTRGPRPVSKNCTPTASPAPVSTARPANLVQPAGWAICTRSFCCSTGRRSTTFLPPPLGRQTGSCPAWVPVSPARSGLPHLRLQLSLATD